MNPLTFILPVLAFLISVTGSCWAYRHGYRNGYRKGYLEGVTAAKTVVDDAMKMRTQGNWVRVWRPDRRQERPS